jgi:hypothetical protein
MGDAVAATRQRGVLDASVTGSGGPLRGVHRISGEVQLDDAGSFGRTDLVSELLAENDPAGAKLLFRTVFFHQSRPSDASGLQVSP